MQTSWARGKDKPADAALLLRWTTRGNYGSNATRDDRTLANGQSVEEGRNAMKSAASSSKPLAAFDFFFFVRKEPLWLEAAPVVQRSLESHF